MQDQVKFWGELPPWTSAGDLRTIPLHSTLNDAPYGYSHHLKRILYIAKEYDIKLPPFQWLSASQAIARLDARIQLAKLLTPL